MRHTLLGPKRKNKKAHFSGGGTARTISGSFVMRKEKEEEETAETKKRNGIMSTHIIQEPATSFENIAKYLRSEIPFYCRRFGPGTHFVFVPHCGTPLSFDIPHILTCQSSKVRVQLAMKSTYKLWTLLFSISHVRCSPTCSGKEAAGLYC